MDKHGCALVKAAADMCQGLGVFNSQESMLSTLSSRQRWEIEAKAWEPSYIAQEIELEVSPCLSPCSTS